MRPIPTGLISLGILLWVSLASAAQESRCQSAGGTPSGALNACKRFSCEAQEACNMAKQVVTSSNDAAARSLAQSFQNRNEVFRAGTDLGNLSANSRESLLSASQYCADLRGGGGQSSSQSKTCASECDPSKDSRYAQQLKAEKDQCQNQIQLVENELNQGANELANSKDGSENTASESGGGQMGQQMGGGEPGKLSSGGGQTSSPTETSSPSTSTTGANTSPQATPAQLTTADCTGDSAANFADCTDGLLAECSDATQSSTPRCSNFTYRYCSKAGTEDTAGSGSTSKIGAGYGTDFCLESRMAGYCATRSQCPSCDRSLGLRTAACRANIQSCVSGLSTDVVQRLQSTCQDDPLFSLPGFSQALSARLNGESKAKSTQTASAAPASFSGSGGRGGMSNTAYPSTGGAEATNEVESQYGALVGMDMAPGGGGGGGENGGEVDMYSAGYEDEGGSLIGGGNKSRGPSSMDVAIGRVAAPSYGPSAMQIMTTVYQTRCANHLHLHCPPKSSK